MQRSIEPVDQRNIEVIGDDHKVLLLEETSDGVRVTYCKVIYSEVRSPSVPLDRTCRTSS